MSPLGISICSVQGEFAEYCATLPGYTRGLDDSAGIARTRQSGDSPDPSE